MAPTNPRKRPSIRSKTTTSKSGSGLISRPSHTSAVVSDSFINSKKDKRTIKHSAFINRIEKAHKQPLKRRRPNKKLVADLGSLEDVLGEIGTSFEEGMDGAETGERKMKLKTLKQGQGALKRKVKVERAERERFGRNMAQLIGSVPQEEVRSVDMVVDGAEGKGGGQEKMNATSSRWAALRGFISQTMEQKAEFRKP